VSEQYIDSIMYGATIKVICLLRLPYENEPINTVSSFMHCWRLHSTRFGSARDRSNCCGLCHCDAISNRFPLGK